MGLVLLLRWPILGLYALAFSIPFGSLREIHLAGMAFGASELILLATLGIWALRTLALRKAWPPSAPLTWAISLYLGTLFLSLWPAQNMASAFKELSKWLELLLLYLFATEELKVHRKGLIAALLLAGSLEGLVGIYQFFRCVGPEEFLLFGRYMRAFGTFLQPNPFGGYMGLLLPLAYATALTSWKEAWHGWQRKQPKPILLWGLAVIAMGIMGAALLMSWSRGALLGLLGGALIVFARLGRRSWWILVVALCLLALQPQGLLPSSLLHRLTEFSQYTRIDLATVEITDENFAIIERLAHWQAAWRIFAQHPWLGAGTGQYATVYPSVALPRWQDPLGHAHNYYLNILAEGGLIGLTAYLAFLLAALRTTWRIAGHAHGWEQGLALGALGMLGHLAVHSIFDNLYVHEMYLLVAMILGAVASVELASKRSPSKACVR
ncbi:MAG: O-antigen ligase family protein [Anaerolineae bacterium]|nr:O-antigen ligase family protein [Anaerolineae bacterium]